MTTLDELLRDAVAEHGAASVQAALDALPVPAPDERPKIEIDLADEPEAAETAPKVYTCDGCGVSATWGGDWRWSGSLLDLDEGHPLLFACSDACGDAVYERRVELLEAKWAARGDSPRSSVKYWRRVREMANDEIRGGAR